MLEILDIEKAGIILSRQSLLFPYGKNRFSHHMAHISKLHRPASNWKVFFLYIIYYINCFACIYMYISSCEKLCHLSRKKIWRTLRLFSIHHFRISIIFSWVRQQRLWSDWANGQADPSLCWAHMSFCWFCCNTSQILFSERRYGECRGCFPSVVSTYLWFFLESDSKDSDQTGQMARLIRVFAGHTSFC